MRQEIPPTSFRPDIEGLRAFAVFLVIADHMWGYPHGGFIGVDVFYVLSGFLITGIILKEFRRTGWVSLRAFYARRVKRIIPAALLVLLVTVAAGYLVWPTPRADQTLLDALSALFFVANWHFVRTGTDYLQAEGPVSPIQHYWSLSVEEQFYVVWPFLLLAVLVMAARKSADSMVTRRRLLAVVSAAAIGSFLWSMLTTEMFSRVAYFDTFSRAWELAAGALVAVTAHRWSALSDRAGWSMATAGVALIVTGAFVISPASPFPGPWALVPVLGTVMVIIGGHAGKRSRLVANPVAQYIGRISYSLYLWHFPVIVYTLAFVPQPGPIAYLVMLALMFSLSALSFHYVEDPIRRSQLFKKHTHPVTVRKRPEVMAGISIAAVLAVLISAQLLGPSMLINGNALRATIASTQTQIEDEGWDNKQDVTEAVATALDKQRWPDELVPSLSTLGSEHEAPQMDTTTGCRNPVDDVDEPNYCERDGTTPGARTALVIGDSVAMSWMPAVEAALPEWEVVGLGFANCPAIPAEMNSQCSKAQAKMADYAQQIQPDLLITSNAQSSLAGLASGAEGDAATREWQDASEAFLRTHTANGTKVAILGNPPAGANPWTCVVRNGNPSRCVSELGAVWKGKAAAEAQAAQNVEGGQYVDVRSWFCDEQGRCPMFMGSSILRFDGNHLTHQTSSNFGSVLRRALE